MPKRTAYEAKQLHEDLCHLSKVFLRHERIDIGTQNERINTWLKNQIHDAYHEANASDGAQRVWDNAIGGYVYK